jgi:head-tail adaptor
MSIGERRERIEIKRKSRVQRADGGFDTTLATIATRWAKVTPLRRTAQTEIELAGSLRGVVRYLIEVDSRGADVNTDDVVVWVTNGDMQLNVREVRAPKRRDLPLEVLAESGVVNSGT